MKTRAYSIKVIVACILAMTAAAASFVSGGRVFAQPPPCWKFHHCIGFGLDETNCEDGYCDTFMPCAWQSVGYPNRMYVEETFYLDGYLDIGASVDRVPCYAVKECTRHPLDVCPDDDSYKKCVEKENAEWQTWTTPQMLIGYNPC